MNCLQPVRSSGQGTIVCKSCATHRSLITRNILCATWYEGTTQPLSLTEFKSQLFLLYCIGWNHLLMKEGRKPEYPKKTADDKLQKMSCTKAWKCKPQPNSNLYSSTSTNLYSSKESRLANHYTTCCPWYSDNVDILSLESTVKYLVSAHYHVSAHPPLLD